MLWLSWILSVTTLLTNANLGWSKGAWWAWLLWALNAGLWQVYTMAIGQWGLTLLNLVTIGMGLVNAGHRLKQERQLRKTIQEVYVSE